MDETARYSKKKAHQSSAMGIHFFLLKMILNSVWDCQINDRLLLSLKMYICFND